MGTFRMMRHSDSWFGLERRVYVALDGYAYVSRRGGGVNRYAHDGVMTSDYTRTHIPANQTPDDVRRAFRLG